MTAYVFSSNLITTTDDVDAVSLTGVDSAYVLEGVTVGAMGSSSRGIYAGSGTHSVVVYGTVISDRSTAIELFGSNHDVYIGRTGNVYGYQGLYINPASNVEVHGTVRAWQSAGILMQAGDNVVTIGATGSVSAEASAIIVNGFYGGTNSKVVNYGTITTTGGVFASGVNFNSQPDQVNRLVNFGTISATGAGVQGEGGNETIINHGRIEGDVMLGDGNDVYRGDGGIVVGLIRGGGGTDVMIGGSGDDAIFGDAGTDRLRGGAGDDTVTGGTGQDILIGGDGADSFDFNAVTESAIGTARDRILDFVRGEDLIDLSGIDAATGPGNQAFTFIGSAAFSGTKGELRAVVSAGSTILSGDDDGDGLADFQILVAAVTGLTAVDFVL